MGQRDIKQCHGVQHILEVSVLVFECLCAQVLKGIKNKQTVITIGMALAMLSPKGAEH